jgi:hypothetical protein
MITATFTDGVALICAIPSKSQNGLYLVRVEPVGEKGLKVTHYCPASRFKTRCSHVEEAVECYREWRWWEPKREEIITVSSTVVLRSEWKQVPTPQQFEKIIEHAGGMERAS